MAVFTHERMLTVYIQMVIEFPVLIISTNIIVSLYNSGDPI